MSNFVNENLVRFETIEVSGFDTSMEGMRNPMNSWSKNDSYYDDDNFIIGDNDINLTQRLIKGGSEECKHIRMINVGVNIYLPRYVWSEFDTYNFNTKCSCSTMHKLLIDGLTEKDFIYHESDKFLLDLSITKINLLAEEYRLCKNYEKQKELIRRAKSLLHEGYIQKRTVMINYQELRNMIKQRKNHRLTEWNEIFIKWCKSLPYADEILFY